MNAIVIRGAREHNLKGIDVDLPRDKLIVITGLSGSGKSSLAFDTIYAEGQRRYVESLSPYARQFLERLGRPDADMIEGLSPTISIEQRSLGKNPRSTVGTITEIYDYLRLLYARAGRPHCPGCGKPITAYSVQQMVEEVIGLEPGTRIAVVAPVVRAERGAWDETIAELRQEGFIRVSVDGTLYDLTETITLDPAEPHTIDVYVDRLVVKEGIRSRLTDSLELALKQTGGLVKITSPDPIDGGGHALLFSEHLRCPDCDETVPDLAPRLFSFNSPQGACRDCGGLGVLLEFDEDLIVPDTERSLREGAIEPWEQRNAAYYQQLLDALAAHYAIDLYAPYGSLPHATRVMLMQGSGETEIAFAFERGTQKQHYRRPFEGVVGNLKRRMDDQRRRRQEGGGDDTNDGYDELLDEFSRYMKRRVCPACDGQRLRREALAVLLGDQHIAAVSAMTIGQAAAFFAGLSFSARDEQVVRRLVDEVRNRIAFLTSVGLDYLTLDRSAATLSGGEAQRVRLATQIGTSLVGVIYILDEPSIGLHVRDHRRLLSTLLALRDKGNSLIVVEHDEETMRSADYVVDLGPRAGPEGGEVVAQGTVDEVMATPRSLTGQYLRGTQAIAVPYKRRRSRQKLVLSGAEHNNLRNLDVTIPLRALVCITGVSGSGKSSLIIDTLLPVLGSRLGQGGADAAGAFREISGVHYLDKVVAIDQSPIGRTPRSNPITYCGAFAIIRDLFAALPDSRARGYRSGRFSFNVKGGRCEACRGDGVLRIAMHFLPDVYVRCDLCGGLRYNDETLRIRYKGLSIADVLSLPVSAALEHFASVPKVRQRLEMLAEVGLGYLVLGQSATTLSGGEAQRLKLARELSRKATGRTLYLLDEPTTGLHFADIHMLLRALNRLVDAGNSIIVIEHNMDVIKSADHVIDLGPEGGEQGGHLVVCGTPEEVAANERSHTGRYLRGALQSAEPS